MKLGDRKWIYKICGIVLSVYTVLVAVLLASTAISIYQDGTAPENLLGKGVYVHPVYSPEIVAEYFKPISGIVYGFLVLALIMCVWSLLEAKAKGGYKLEAIAKVHMLEKRIDQQKLETPEGHTVKSEQSYRKRLLIGQAAIYLVCVGVASLWLFAPTSFGTEDLEAMVKQLALNVFPWIGLGLLTALVGAELSNRSAARELTALVKIVNRKQSESTSTASRKRMVARLAAYAVAIAFVALGISNNGMRDVFVKAINICTECVGLG